MSQRSMADPREYVQLCAQTREANRLHGPGGWSSPPLHGASSVSGATYVKPLGDRSLTSDVIINNPGSGSFAQEVGPRVGTLSTQNVYIPNTDGSPNALSLIPSSALHMELTGSFQMRCSIISLSGSGTSANTQSNTSLSHVTGIVQQYSATVFFPCKVFPM